MNFKKQFKKDFFDNFDFDDRKIDFNGKLQFNQNNLVNSKKKSYKRFLFVPITALASFSIIAFVTIFLIESMSSYDKSPSMNETQENTRFEDSIFASNNESILNSFEPSFANSTITTEESVTNETTQEPGLNNKFINCFLLYSDEIYNYITCDYDNPIFKDENGNNLDFEKEVYDGIECYKIKKGNYYSIIASEI